MMTMSWFLLELSKDEVCLLIKLNDVTVSFTDQMLESLAGFEYYCFLDGYCEYN